MPDNDFEKVYGFVTDIIRKTYDTAVLAETRLTSDGPDVDRRYWAGQVDACVAILKVAQPGVDWLADIRLAATLERSLG